MKNKKEDINLDMLEKKHAKIFEIYSYFLGCAFFLLLVEYGLYHFNLILRLFDLFFSIINIILFIFSVNKIIFIKNNLNIITDKKYNLTVCGFFLSFVVAFIFLLSGFFLIFLFIKKTVYIFTACSLGIICIIQSLIFFYFILKSIISGVN